MKTAGQSILYWSTLAYQEWSLLLAATPRGLCYTGAQQKEAMEGLTAWTRIHAPDKRLVRNNEQLQPYITQLIEYFRGERSAFTFPLDVMGTRFQLAVWKEVSRIPIGETRSYAEIANDIGKPSSTRAVGAAIGTNPVLIAVPCHRVIGKNGSLTGYRGGLEMKSRLLQVEKMLYTHERK